jgi:hypothetical protein
MDEIIREITTVHFWFAVVLVDIVGRLIAEYLKALLDRIASKFWGAWRRRSHATAAAQAIRVEELRRDKHKQLLVLADEARHRWRTSFYMLVAFSVLIVTMLARHTVAEPTSFQSTTLAAMRIFSMFVALIAVSSSLKLSAIERHN